MRTIDFTPLYRNTVGFDRFANMVDSALSGEAQQAGYPPYNIEKLSEDDYRVTVAVAGFVESEIDIETHEGYLTVKGSKTPAELPEGVTTLYQVAGATLENGLLHINLVREVPEALKPRKIEIGKTVTQPKIVSSDTAAA